jgi:hypothetical protein
MILLFQPRNAFWMGTGLLTLSTGLFVLSNILDDRHGGSTIDLLLVFSLMIGLWSAIAWAVTSLFRS